MRARCKTKQDSQHIERRLVDGDRLALLSYRATDNAAQQTANAVIDPDGDTAMLTSSLAGVTRISPSGRLMRSLAGT